MDETTFVTKDSGKREQFESGMVRDTQDGKARFDLAIDGPLAAAVFKSDRVFVAFNQWYVQGGLDLAARVALEIGDREGTIYTLLERYAGLMTRGAVKYTERNWMQAAGEAELKRFISSACRHLVQYLRGDKDEDHAAAVWFNINGAEYVREKLG